MKLRLTSLAVTAGVFSIVGYKYYTCFDNIKYTKLSEIYDSYDYIVIGAGTCGSIVARRLCEQDTNYKPNVLLIEAGSPDIYHPLSKQVIPAACRDLRKTNIDWQYYTQSKIYWPRGKVCGGSSVLNAMLYVRGHPNDYNEWQDIHHCKGWSYDQILPYFKKIEDIRFETNDINKQYRGIHGLQKISIKNPKTLISDLFIKSCINQGYKYNNDYNGFTQDGISLTQYTTFNGQRMTSYRSYIAPLFKSSYFGLIKKCKYNLHILPYSHVTKLLTDTKYENKKNKNELLTVNGVEIVYKNNKNKKININIKEKGEIILSAGAINSPQILMLSGIGEYKHLKSKNIQCIKNIPGVGKNLQDHCKYTKMRLKVPKNMPLFTKQIVPFALFDYIFNGKGWLTSITTDTQLYCLSESGKQLGIKTNDLQLVACPVADIFNKDKENYYSFVGGIFPLRPTSFGEIKLKNNDPFEAPIINYKYLQTEYDKNCLVDGILLMKEIMNNKIFKQYGCNGIIMDNKSIDDEDDNYWNRESLLNGIQDEVSSNYHPCGTLKMGDINNDIMCVCNERLLVRGFNNLRVIDASVIPRINSGNIQAPCYAIAEKGAHMIIQDSQKS